MTTTTMNDDASKLWNAVLKEWNIATQCGFAIEPGECVVMAKPLGQRMGIPVNEIQRLTDKWDREGKWTKVDATSGTDIVSS